jgi:hypothetical protein
LQPNHVSPDVLAGGLIYATNDTNNVIKDHLATDFVDDLVEIETRQYDLVGIELVTTRPPSITNRFYVVLGLVSRNQCALTSTWSAPPTGPPTRRSTCRAVWARGKPRPGDHRDLPEDDLFRRRGARGS